MLILFFVLCEPFFCFELNRLDILQTCCITFIYSFKWTSSLFIYVNDNTMCV